MSIFDTLRIKQVPIFDSSIYVDNIITSKVCLYSLVRTNKYAGFRQVAGVYLYIQQNLTKVYIAGHATVLAWSRAPRGAPAFTGVGWSLLNPSPASAGGIHRRRRCEYGVGAPYARAQALSRMARTPAPDGAHHLRSGHDPTAPTGANAL